MTALFRRLPGFWLLGCSILLTLIIVAPWPRPLPRAVALPAPDTAAASSQIRPAVELSPPGARRVPVLVYHHLAPASLGLHRHNPMVVPVELFERQIAWLDAQGYTTVSLAELAAFIAGHGSLPQRSVMITFDDGYESNFRYATPILRRHGLRAVLFTIGNRVRPDDWAFAPDRTSHVSWQQLRAMAGGPVWEIGHHTFAGHDPIDGEPPLVAWSAAEIAADLATFTAAWKEHGLPQPTAFAYPFGAYDAEAVTAIAAAGFELAFTVDPGFVTVGSDPLRLPRLGVFPWHELAALGKLLADGE
ncbi:MAG TPA: polysaccharide deacetylase family protein [Bacillota bacterium]